ncbi:hypothetical protein LNTAR_12982 [Lentisphaera araneosa HTCC2155]|uniref:Uncharacterized protein n=1 Tax=Lentisphaera araneosa HTCC2155 TaxID=313628 RepID=A6DRJ5_9BACT|nr:hypothetical protein [Lentisphaera araneosa]EDM25664.1 hypothetical protein LNTAR_12982 [Lentisphaera araneosa HTCC2155]
MIKHLLAISSLIYYFFYTLFALFTHIAFTISFFPESVMELISKMNQYTNVLGGVAFPMLFIGFMTDALNYYSRAYFIALIFISIFWLFIYPFGTVMASVVIFYCVHRIIINERKIKEKTLTRNWS